MMPPPQAFGKLAGRVQLHASSVSYAEVLAGVELGRHDEGSVRGFFAHLVDELHPVDRDVAERAAKLRGANPAIKMPDALILATAESHEAEVVITADQRWVGVLASRRVEVLRPTTDGEEHPG